MVKEIKKCFSSCHERGKKIKNMRKIKEKEKKLHIVTNEIVRVEGFINFIKQKKQTNKQQSWYMDPFCTD